MRWKKKMTNLLFLVNIKMYIFYVAAYFLFKVCLVYILLDLAQKPQVSRLKIFLREKLYLKNSKIGRRREARRIKTSLIEI